MNKTKATLIIQKTKKKQSLKKFPMNEGGATFATLFEDVRHERSLISVPSSTDPDKIKQTAFMDSEIFLRKSLAFDKIQRQKTLREFNALQLID